MTSNSQLDPFDRKILVELGQDGRMSVTELARRVGLSKSPTQSRLQRLIREGFIQGFRAVLDPARLDRNHVAFVEVKLTDTTEPALRAFNQAVLAMPEIEQCHMIAGSFDYLLKVRSRDIGCYRRVLGEKISALPFVGNTATNVSMEAIKESAF
ncbi:Lrp/AsnC ligand binding domain-containing protein [Fluviibacterium sp. DFM31]|uniref:Lrp/AsnC ligand binding domain-containing protein n=1 Tax=Meridianimarinicoccus marinus TaxID=3231483 RepID=A0ABV3L5D9_9RHOB